MAPFDKDPELPTASDYTTPADLSPQDYALVALELAIQTPGVVSAGAIPVARAYYDFLRNPEGN